jgi:hypothetical protein
MVFCKNIFFQGRPDARFFGRIESAEDVQVETPAEGEKKSDDKKSETTI